MKFYDMSDPLNLEYARSRLIGSIVKLDKRAIYIEDIGGRTAYFHYLTNPERKQETCKLGDIDITPVELGYVNYDNIYYLTRMPMRRDWRQGFRSLSCSTPTNRRVDVPNTVIGKCIEGIYPSFDEAIKSVTEGAVGTAFSRNFAVVKGMILQYKERFNVGNIENGNYVLEPKFEWVREALEEELV